jgi:hypothetical protein
MFGVGALRMQVQKQSIPVLLGGRDALVRSPTGSGKTLAYLAPMVHSLAGAQPRITRADGTFAVVLVPTRELAVQVSKGQGVVKHVALVMGVKSALVRGWLTLGFDDSHSVCSKHVGQRSVLGEAVPSGTAWHRRLPVVLLLCRRCLMC